MSLKEERLRDQVKSLEVACDFWHDKCKRIWEDLDIIFSEVENGKKGKIVKK